MRDQAPGAAGVVALFVILALPGKAFDSSAKGPAHALEPAAVRAEADAARAERDRQTRPGPPQAVARPVSRRPAAPSAPRPRSG